MDKEKLILQLLNTLMSNQFDRQLYTREIKMLFDMLMPQTTNQIVLAHKQTKQSKTRSNGQK